MANKLTTRAESKKAPSAAAAAAALKADETANAAAAAEALKTAGAADAPPPGANQPPADPADGAGADPAPGALDAAGAPGAAEQPPGPPAATPDTPEAASAPAPETTQEHAGAGETQDQSIPSGKNGPDPVIGLRITAAREGFRRAGRAWSRQPTDVPLADLSDDQVKLLQEEHGRMLTVEEIVLP